jgi:hypothetical protein
MANCGFLCCSAMGLVQKLIELVALLSPNEFCLKKTQTQIWVHKDNINCEVLREIVFGPSFTPYPLFQWYPQSKDILENLSMKC